jgi:hypothetical protein
VVERDFPASGRGLQLKYVNYVLRNDSAQQTILRNGSAQPSVLSDEYAQQTTLRNGSAQLTILRNGPAQPTEIGNGSGQPRSYFTESSALYVPVISSEPNRRFEITILTP